MRKIAKWISILMFLFIISTWISCNSENKSQIKTLSGKIIDKSELDSFIEEQMDSLNIKGISIAIISEGELVYHSTKGIADIEKMEKVNNKTLFEAASISKPVFAWFVMRQVEKGLIDLDIPLYKYLQYADIEHDDRYKLITARMILCHTSGLPNWRWLNPDHKLDIKFTPGTKFLYSGEGYLYLSKVIAHINGLNLSNLDSLYQKEVAELLHLHHAYFKMNKYVKDNLARGHQGNRIVYDQYSDRSKFSAAGGMHSEAFSFANFIINIIQNRGLKPDSYVEMLKEQNIRVPEEDGIRKELGVTGWSLGFAITHSSNGVIYSHGGNNIGYTSGFKFNKEKKYGYVFFTNSDNRNEFDNNIYAFLMKNN